MGEENTKKNSIKALTSSNVKYSYYPFDKKEEEIVDALEEDSDEELNSEIVSKLEESDIDPNNNFVDDISIDHKQKWFSDKNTVDICSVANTYQDIIENMKQKRQKDVQEYAYRSDNPTDKTVMRQMHECNKTCCWPSSTSIYCWWCSHPFEGHPCALPYEYCDSKFKVYGIFCSPECAAAYNFDNYEAPEVWEKYSLLNFLYRKVYNDKNIKIKVASPRQTLKIFGGNLTIKEFRILNSNYSKNFKMVIPPMISIIPQQEFNFIDNGYSSKINKKYVALQKDKISNSELRLKRSKPFIPAKNTLEKCMNLKMAN